jgi:hypothetical protein
MEKKQPNFLKNTPIGDDLFEGKSQEKIGVVIADIIKNKNFQIIGIDGAWGTGKSNLVKIVEKKLSDYKFFIYDVWGHQEDDQRKAILVELTEFISGKENNIIANNTKWEDKLKKLLSKEKEVTTINRPYLSVGFIFSLFSIIYVPTVNVFKDSMVDFFGIEKLFWKLVLVIFPIFIVLGIYTFNLISSWINEKGFWFSFKLASQKTFQVYTNKQEEETKIETISENEPSVKDFRNWMKEIDTDLGNKKLILVFDNFDRLPKKQILSIWSSIHIFFAEEDYKNIKVIIPFDRLHIKNAFKELDSNNGINDYANDYINKTFDLVYRISQPILSDWKVFFKERWKEAFTTVDESEFLKVIQIYEVYRTTITPREIIACINEIVSIKLLDDTIPDRYIALFVLNQDYIINDPLKAISNPEFLKGLSYLYKDDENFQKNITALAYQINSKDALEVAYRKQLKDSLVNKKDEVFLEISKTNVFNKIILSVISEIENFDNPIIVLNSLVPESKISDIEKNNVWDNIYLKVINSFHDNFDIVEYQKVIVKHVSVEKAEKWIAAIIKKLKTLENFEPVKFSKLMDEFNNYLKDNSIPIDIYNILEVSGIKYIDAESFTSLVKEAKENYKNYKVSTTNDELIEYLNTLNTIGIENAEFIKYIIDDFDFVGFKNKLEELIETNKADVNVLAVLFKRLKQVSIKPLEIELADVDIYNLFLGVNDTQDFYYDIVAMRLSKLNNFNRSYVSTFATVLNLDDDIIAEKIAERIEYFINYDDFLIGSKDFTDSILYRSVAKKIIANDYGVSKANLRELLENFELICTNIEIEPDEFIDDLKYWNCDDLKPENLINFPLFLFQSLMKNDSKLSKDLLNLVNEYFTSINNKDEWVSIYSNFGDFKFNLLKVIDFQGWNSYSSEGLKEVLIDSITNSNFSDSKEWFYLFDSFKKSGLSLANTLKDIRDKLYSDGTLIKKDLFLFLLESFIEYSSLIDRPGDSFRTIFKTEFLDDLELINLMMKNSEAIKELLQKSNQSDVSDFKQAIRDRKDSNLSISELANKLDIRAKK